MARPRTPKAKAEVTGRTKRDPKRFEERAEPRVSQLLGDPPEWFTEIQVKAWDQFKKELFWLDYSHRALLEIASAIRARLMLPSADGQEVGVQALNLLRQCLGQMGATPADASKVKLPDGEGGPEDPADKYLD